MRTSWLLGVMAVCASAALVARAGSNGFQGERPLPPSETIDVVVQGCLTQGASNASGGGSSTNWTHLEGGSFTLSQATFTSGGAAYDHLSGSLTTINRPTAFTLQRPMLSSLSLGDYRDQLVEVVGTIGADTVSRVQPGSGSTEQRNFLGPGITVESVKTIAGTCPTLP